MRIYDTFVFYNEFALLKWRLKMLSPFVDYFVLVEGKQTFQGKEKPFYFEEYLKEHQEEFEEYLLKIIHIKIDNQVTGIDDFAIETYQRNAIAKGLKDVQDDDVILLSDVDEIPSPNILQNIRDGKLPIRLFGTYGYADERAGVRGLSRNIRSFFKTLKFASKKNNPLEFLNYSPVVMEMQMMEFYANLERRSHWFGTILFSGQYWRENQGITMDSIRRQRNKLPATLGGWHFSSLGGVEAVKRKYRATSDGRYNPVFKLPEEEQNAFIEKHLKEGVIWWLNEQCETREIESLDIPYIEWFARTYPEMIKK